MDKKNNKWNKYWLHMDKENNKWIEYWPHRRHLPPGSWWWTLSACPKDKCCHSRCHSRWTPTSDRRSWHLSLAMTMKKIEITNGKLSGIIFMFSLAKGKTHFLMVQSVSQSVLPDCLFSSKSQNLNLYLRFYDYMASLLIKNKM